MQTPDSSHESLSATAQTPSTNREQSVISEVSDVPGPITPYKFSSGATGRPRIRDHSPTSQGLLRAAVAEIRLYILVKNAYPDLPTFTELSKAMYLAQCDQYDAKDRRQEFLKKESYRKSIIHIVSFSDAALVARITLIPLVLAKTKTTSSSPGSQEHGRRQNRNPLRSQLGYETKRYCRAG